MKNVFEKFATNQVWLRADGTFILIKSVDPLTKIKNTDKDRMIFYITGDRRISGDEFNDDIYIINNDSTDSDISFNMKKTLSATIASFKNMEMMYLGSLTQECIDDIVRKFY